MELTTTTFLSLDGVYQGPGGPTEDTSGGFDRGGWLVPHFDDETGSFMIETFAKPEAFLLGRRTYDIFAAAWPANTDPDDPVASKLNGLPKHVASRTLKDPAWNNTTVLQGDTAQAVRDLKARPGGELQVHGSGELIRFLLDNELVDGMNVLVFPVVVGKGKRLFPDGGIDIRMVLEESRTTPSGVTISAYRPAGRPEYGTASVQ
jgi:dihydrofolate reductase